MMNMQHEKSNINYKEIDMKNFDDWVSENMDGLQHIYDVYSNFKTSLSRDIEWEDYLRFMYLHS